MLLQQFSSFCVHLQMWSIFVAFQKRRESNGKKVTVFVLFAYSSGCQGITVSS